MDALEAARARQDAELAARRPIDYDRMQRVFPRQKAALTRATKSGDVARLARVIREAIREWDEIGAWPDDWALWQRALDDAVGYAESVDIRYLRDEGGQ